MSNDLLLAGAQVQRWLSRQAEITAAIDALQSEAADIKRKLDAVQVLFGSVPSEGGSDQTFAYIQNGSMSETHPHSEESDKQNFSEVIIEAIKALGGVPKPAEIKQWIISHNGGEIAHRAKQQYFYTALSRSVSKERLIKEGDGYRLPTSSAEAETGVATPDPETHSDGKTYGGTEERPEAGGI